MFFPFQHGQNRWYHLTTKIKQQHKESPWFIIIQLNHTVSIEPCLHHQTSSSYKYQIPIAMLEMCRAHCTTLAIQHHTHRNDFFMNVTLYFCMRRIQKNKCLIKYPFSKTHTYQPFIFKMREIFMVRTINRHNYRDQYHEV